METPDLTLTGWRHSIYTAIVRLVLAEKQLTAAFDERDPFTQGDDPALSPFGRVPVLRQSAPSGDFVIFETLPICLWLDETFAGPVLQPEGARARGRMMQAIAIMDDYGYRPMVRDVYGAGVFTKAEGLPCDPARVTAGLAAASAVLAALDVIAAEGLVLATPDTPTLADLHLAPMFLAFTRLQAGSALLADCPALAAWWHGIAERPTLRAALAPLPSPGTLAGLSDRAG